MSLPAFHLRIADLRVGLSSCVPPTEPIGVAVNGTRQTDVPLSAQFLITWLTPLIGTSPFTFTVYRFREGLETSNVLLGTTEELSWLQSNLPLDVPHCFYVTATNDCGTSGNSIQVCDTVSSDIHGPSNLHGLGICEGEMFSLLWEVASDTGSVGGYHLYRDGVLLANLSRDTTSFIDTQPGIEVVHTYELRTYDLGGTEIPSLTLTLADVFACEWFDCNTEMEPEEGQWTILQTM